VHPHGKVLALDVRGRNVGANRLARDFDLPRPGAIGGGILALVALLTGRLAVVLHQHGVVDLAAECALHSLQIGLMAVGGELDPVGEAAAQIVHEGHGIFAVPRADHVGDHQLRIAIQRGPRPRIASPFRGSLGVRNVLLLGVGEAPDLVALDPSGPHADDVLVVILRARLARIDQQLVDRDLAHIGKACRRTDAVTLHEAAEDQGAGFGVELVHFGLSSICKHITHCASILQALYRDYRASIRGDEPMTDIDDAEHPKDPAKSRAGHARSKSLSPEARAEIARKAAQARWAKPVEEVEEEPQTDTDGDEALTPIPEMPVARWRGTLNIVGLEVPCYVLDDGQKIIGRVSVTELLTGIKGGGALEKYIGVKSLEPFINKDLVLERFVPFRLAEVEGLERAVKGLPADLMIEVCQSFVAALQSTFDPKSTHPRMSDRQIQMAMNASAFLSACAKLGLEALIDEATGYQYERAEDALQVKLRAFIADELRAWEKTFPDELWAEFGRLTGWQGGLTSRPKWWGKLVIELIYETLDPDVANYLKNNKPPPGVRWHRQLTENIGVRALVSRCYEIIGMAKDCHDMRELREKVARHYGREVVQLSLSLPVMGRD
jgi:hypothetical protein